MNKRTQRLRRAQKTRMRIKKLGVETDIARLTVHRTAQHIYGQILAPKGGKVLASASTIDKELRTQLKGKSKTEASVLVGKLLVERAKKAGVDRVASDRSGFRFHGRLKALIDAVCENGIQV